VVSNAGGVGDVKLQRMPGRSGAPWVWGLLSVPLPEQLPAVPACVGLRPVLGSSLAATGLE